MRRPLSKVVLALAAISVAAGALSAQDWAVGLKGGIGKGSFTGVHEFVWQSSPINGAVFFQRQIGSHFAFQPEIAVAQKLGVSTITGSTLTFKSDYLDFPFLARYSLFGPHAIRPYVLLGPTFSFRLNCSLEFITTGILSKGPCDGASLDDKLDFGLAGGVGISKDFGTVTFHVEGRGGFSARSVIVPLESSSSRAQWWNVMFGASVPLRIRSPFLRRAPVSPNAPPPALPRMDTEVASQQPAQHPQDSAPVLPGEILGAQPHGAAPETRVSMNEKRVTMTAQEADARSLLIAIAKASGVSLVVSNDVKRKVSLSLNDAPVDQAIAAIIAQAGLSISRPMESVAPVVYYQLPVNVNEAPAETIAVRFGVSSEMAKWISENRTPPKQR